MLDNSSISRGGKAVSTPTDITAKAKEAAERAATTLAEKLFLAAPCVVWPAESVLREKLEILVPPILSEFAPLLRADAEEIARLRTALKVELVKNDALGLHSVLYDFQAFAIAQQRRINAALNPNPPTA